MIKHVSIAPTTEQPPPPRFEAGTAPIVGPGGLGVVPDYPVRLGGVAIAAAEQALILRRFGLTSTLRPSFALGNGPDHADALVRSLHRLAGGTGAKASGRCDAPPAAGDL